MLQLKLTKNNKVTVHDMDNIPILSASDRLFTCLSTVTLTELHDWGVSGFLDTEKIFED